MSAAEQEDMVSRAGYHVVASIQEIIATGDKGTRTFSTKKPGLTLCTMVWCGVIASLICE
jgi:hypothetical protein